MKPVQLRKCRNCGEWITQHERGWWYDPARGPANSNGTALCSPSIRGSKEHQPVDEIALPDFADLEAVGAWLDA